MRLTTKCRVITKVTGCSAAAEVGHDGAMTEIWVGEGSGAMVEV